jgi:hypothetical protein
MVPDNVGMKFRMAYLLRENLIRDFQNSKQLSLPVDYVYMCFDLTAMLLLERNIFDPFFIFSTYFEDCQQNSFKRLLASSCLSISLSVLPHSTTSFA